MASTEIPAQLCGYVYAKLANPAPGNEGSILVYNGGLAGVAAAVANYTADFAWVVVSSGSYVCSQGPPPPPDETPPGGGGGGGGSGDGGGPTDNPPTSGPPPITGPGGGGGPIVILPPPGGGGGGNGEPGDGDDTESYYLAAILAELVAIETTLQTGIKVTGNTTDQPDTECCAEVTTAINAVGLAITAIGKALAVAPTGGGGVIDLAPVIEQLTALNLALAPLQDLFPALLKYLAEPPCGCPPLDLSEVVAQLTRIANRADRETADDDNTIKALVTIDADIEAVWAQVGNQG